MSSHTRFHIAAALLVASLAGTFAHASDVIGGSEAVAACIAEYRIVFRSDSHPGKSDPFLRKELNASSRCADAAPSPLYLTVYTDAPGGTVLLEGEYDAAIAEIRQDTRPSAIDSLPLTNLCVAQIAARQWEAARPTCDAAIEASRRDRVRAPSWPYEVRVRYKDYVAIAYSNRAVLNLLADDMTAGEDDLTQAEKIAPRAVMVKRNLAAMQAVREARVLASSTPKQ